MPALLRTNKAFLEIYNRHADTVYRVCFSFMKNRPEAEDMTQETFLRLLSSGKEFENERHEKAWLIVTASNLCKDALKKWWRKHECIEDHLDIPAARTREYSIYEAVLMLQKDYKTVVYMYYYEGFSTAEIAQYLHCPESTVRSRLSRARKQLRTILGGDA